MSSICSGPVGALVAIPETIDKIEGRVRGVGKRVRIGVRHALRNSRDGDFRQFEPAFGVIPGAGGAQHLARVMGRARALEVMLSAQDYDADLAERYGWVNRALPAAELDDFVRLLAHRIAKFPNSLQRDNYRDSGAVSLRNYAACRGARSGTNSNKTAWRSEVQGDRHENKYPR